MGKVGIYSKDIKVLEEMFFDNPIINVETAGKMLYTLLNYHNILSKYIKDEKLDVFKLMYFIYYNLKYDDEYEVFYDVFMELSDLYFTRAIEVYNLLSNEEKYKAFDYYYELNDFITDNELTEIDEIFSDIKDSVEENLN